MKQFSMQLLRIEDSRDYPLELTGVVYVHKNHGGPMGEPAGRSALLASYGPVLRPVVQ